MLCQQKVPLKDILDKAESWGLQECVDLEILEVLHVLYVERETGYEFHNLLPFATFTDFHAYCCILNT